MDIFKYVLKFMLKIVIGKKYNKIFRVRVFCVFDFYGECRWYLLFFEEGSVGNFGIVVK